MPHATCTQRRQQADPELEHGRLKGKHFPIKISGTENQNKRKYPAKCCKICNFTQPQHHYMHIGPSLPTKYTTFTFQCVSHCVSKYFIQKFITENVPCNTVFVTTYRYVKNTQCINITINVTQVKLYNFYCQC